MPLRKLKVNYKQKIHLQAIKTMTKGENNVVFTLFSPFLNISQLSSLSTQIQSFDDANRLSSFSYVIEIRRTHFYTLNYLH